MPHAARFRAFALAAVPAALLSSCVPAHAEPVAGALVLPWGDALAALLQGLVGVLVPVGVAVVTTVTARFAGPLRILITTTLVERLVRNATEYALNAVAGAVRGRTLSVPLGSAVIAKAVERALEQGAPWLVRAAGGRAGLAEKVFRSLPLEDAATVGNTLRPVLGGARSSNG